MIRFFDVMLSLVGIILLSPLFIIIFIWVFLETPGGAIFKQKRVGQGNKNFILYKFRTMYYGSDKKSLLTVGSRESRITKSGYYLRKYKLDEVPQLFNVLKGDMSIVGPRPEVRKYVDLYDENQKEILKVKPGLTDIASLTYYNENELLASSPDPERYYVEHIMPHKLELNMKFKENPTLKNYFNIIFQTVKRTINQHKK